jgi:hypothetical protein
MEQFYNKEYLDCKNNKINLNIQNIIDLFSFIKPESLYVDYRFFKILTKNIDIQKNIDLINIYYNKIIYNIEELLKDNKFIFIHVNIEKFSLTDFDKYSELFTKLSNLFLEKYPDILNKLYVYGSGIIFDKLIKMFSMVLTKETRQKMILINE